MSVNYWKQPDVRRAGSCVSDDATDSPISSDAKPVNGEPSESAGEPEAEYRKSPSQSFSDVDSGIGSSCSTNSEEAVLWDPKEAFRTMTEQKKNVYPFTLIPVEKDFKEPWNIYPRFNTVMKDQEGIEKMIHSHDLFVLLWHNSPNDNARCETKNLIFDEDSSCQSLLKERERTYRGCSETATLQDCIHLLTQPEVLSKVNAWMCPTCKLPREASKKFEIWSLPTVLVFQLKRFSKPSAEIWRRDKIDTMVDYPLKELDMSSFLVGPGDGGQYLYDLYGAVIHRGSTWYGHYVAHARCYNVPNTEEDDVAWRFCDDDSVEREEFPERVVDRGAYILFYRRRGTDNPIFVPSRDDSDDDIADAMTDNSYKG